MTRNGTIEVKIPTTNQCRKKDHTEFSYNIVILFHKHVQLDKKKFIIDHVEIDNALQAIHFQGSCEEIQLLIVDTLNDLFLYNKRLKDNVMAFKCVLKPVTADLKAWITIVKVYREDLTTLAYLPLLNS